MGKQNTCNPKSACRTHTTSKGTASAWSVYSSRSYHSNRTVHWLFSAPATQASQPLHPGDSCSSSPPWQCHSWPQAAVKQTLRQKYKDSQRTGTAALRCFKFNMIIHRHSSFKDFWGVSLCWPNALHKFTTLRSFAPLWSRDRFRSFWLSKRENRQPPEWCCLKQNTRYDSIRFKQKNMIWLVDIRYIDKYVDITCETSECWAGNLRRSGRKVGGGNRNGRRALKATMALQHQLQNDIICLLSFGARRLPRLWKGDNR